MIGGNFSEPATTSLIGERPLTVRARPVSGGYRMTGRKMFASMIEAADYVLVLVYPDARKQTAGMLAMIPAGAEGRQRRSPIGIRLACGRPAAIRWCWMTAWSPTIRYLSI